MCDTSSYSISKQPVIARITKINFLSQDIVIMTSIGVSMKGVSTTFSHALVTILVVTGQIVNSDSQVRPPGDTVGFLV